jgi:hypothetical protein
VKFFLYFNILCVLFHGRDMWYPSIISVINIKCKVFRVEVLSFEIVSLTS